MNEGFIKDLVDILKEKMAQAASEADKTDFEKGEEYAYYDSLDIIKSQLIAFGYDPKVFGLDHISLSGKNES